MIAEQAAGVLAVVGVVLIVTAVAIGGRQRGRRARIGFWFALAGTACELISYFGYGIHHFPR